MKEACRCNVTPAGLIIISVEGVFNVSSAVLSVDKAEDFANQILSLCQEIRNVRYKRINKVAK